MINGHPGRNIDVHLFSAVAVVHFDDVPMPEIDKIPRGHDPAPGLCADLVADVGVGINRLDRLALGEGRVPRGILSISGIGTSSK